jgi:hypothetical protein
LLKKSHLLLSPSGLVIAAYKQSTLHASFLDSSHLELFEQPAADSALSIFCQLKKSHLLLSSSALVIAAYKQSTPHALHPYPYPSHLKPDDK